MCLLYFTLVLMSHTIIMTYHTVDVVNRVCDLLAFVCHPSLDGDLHLRLPDLHRSHDNGLLLDNHSPHCPVGTYEHMHMHSHSQTLKLSEDRA